MKEKLHIVQIVEKLEVGGLERLAVDLAVAQKAAGHSPSMYCIFSRGPLAVEAETAGVPVSNFAKQPGFSPRTIQSLAHRLRLDRADVVHTHSSGIHHYGVLAARMAGVPLVVNTRHGLGTLHIPIRQNLYFRATMPFTNAVVFVAEAARRFFVERRGVPARKAHVILNGIPLEKFLGYQATPGNLHPRIRFGTVGRLVKAKAHSVLLEAFARIAPRLPHAELHIYGGGELLETLRNQVEKLGLAGRVVLAGPTNRTREVLAEMDIFVLSSISEGLPVAVQEAMAIGLPIVTTRVGGVSEIAPERDVAWYCEPGNPVALAQVMEKAANSDRLGAMGCNARKIASSRFDISHTQAGYAALFQNLLERRS